MTKQDADFVKGKGTVIAINNTYELASWADVLYACDRKWWIAHPRAKAFKGRKVSVEYEQVERVRTNRSGVGLGLDSVHTGGNSGYQAINFAFLEGATRIILLGYDMAGSHWHGQHKRGLSNVHNFKDWIPRFGPLASDLKKQGVEVINCSRQTKLKCFKRQALESIKF